MARNADMIDVRTAANLVRRHPETIRRWVWTGRLVAEREGNRLLLARADVEAAAAAAGSAPTDLATWAEQARAARESSGTSGSRRSSADLVIEDRAERSKPGEARAGR